MFIQIYNLTYNDIKVVPKKKTNSDCNEKKVKSIKNDKIKP